MDILYLSQYFPPEAGATQTRAYEMARNFVRLGHTVTMIAEVPNHPSGIIRPEFRGKLFHRAGLEGIDVIRVWVKASPLKDFRSRMLFYLTYMLNAALAGLLLAGRRYNLIYASSPPLFVGGAALALSALKRTPLVFEVRDLWPESAVALGEISNPRASRPGHAPGGSLLPESAGGSSSLGRHPRPASHRAASRLRNWRWSRTAPMSSCSNIDRKIAPACGKNSIWKVNLWPFMPGSTASPRDWKAWSKPPASCIKIRQWRILRSISS